VRTKIPAELHARVIVRTGERSEYCHKYFADRNAFRYAAHHGGRSLKILRGSEALELTQVTQPSAKPSSTNVVRHWLDGPTFGDVLDVGLMSFLPGAGGPPHIHLGGQVIVVISGRGFVEANGERETIATGDIVVAPPGERHAHGPALDSHFTHLSVSTGGVQFVEPVE
jgi:quercetin dioxygenase-like cupin family protein